MEQLTLSLTKTVSIAFQKAKRWQHPPNWNAQQWCKEIEAIAWEAALEAYLRFNPERNVLLEAFVFSHIMAALKDFYRREWSYAFHCIPPQTEGEEESENWEFAFHPQEREGNVLQKATIRWMLSQLDEKEKFVIERLFWDGLTEREIAQTLDVSQQAVSKIKKKALQKLREILS